MTQATVETLGSRLARLGMPLEGEMLERAERIVRVHGERPQALSDLVLLTICVEAYRRPDSDVPPWV